MPSFAINNLLPPQPVQPPPTKLGVHSVNWWGDSHHPDSGFKSDDPQVISRHMDLMISAGIQYNVCNWRGDKVNPTQHRAFLGWITEAQKRTRSTPFQVGLQIDVGMFPALTDPTAELITQLSGITDYLKSPCYFDNLVLEFGTEAVALDWSKVKTAFPSLRFCFRKKDFLWPEAVNTLQVLKAQYAQAPAPIMGYAMWQFDDGWSADRTKTVWPPKPGAVRGPVRWIPHNYGRLWFDTFSAAPSGLPYLSVVTWDDFEEGTAIAHLVAMMAGQRL